MHGDDVCVQDSYLSSAAAYLSQTQLSKRVLEWQDRLEPILEEEVRRTHQTCTHQRATCNNTV